MIVPTLQNIVDEIADALWRVDQQGVAYKHYQSGVGPFTEAGALKLAFSDLSSSSALGGWRAGSYPASRQKCDILVGEHWAIEAKLVRPFGDNDKEEEHWVENALYPFPKRFNNDSAISDCYKLLDAEWNRRIGVMMFGYEHAEPRIELGVVFDAFELLSRELLQLPVAARVEAVRETLRHPTHQRLIVAAWELTG